MRKLLLLLLIMPVLVKAQTDTANFEWDIVTNTTGTKDELFSRAQNWAAKILKNPKYAIQIQDREGGKMIINANYTGPTLDDITLKIRVDVKDNKFRFKTYDYVYHLNYGRGLASKPVPLSSNEDAFKGTLISKKRRQSMWIDIKNSAINQTKDLYEALKEDMNKSDSW